MPAPHRRAPLDALALMVACALSTSAWASTPEKFELSYSLPSAMSHCPSPLTLRREVSRRLGRSPWSERAARRLEVSIRSVRGKLVASVLLREADGRVSGRRRLDAAPSECRELGEAIALALSVAIDPSRAVLAPSSRAVAAQPRKTARRARPARVDGRASTSNVARVAKSATGSASRLAWTVRSALHLALGAAPAASGGVTLQLAVRRGWLRLGVEGRFDARSSEDLAGQAAVDAMFVGGALLGCGHWRWLYGCAAVTLGALSGGGRGLVDAQRVSTVYFAPGLRAGLDVPLFWRLFGYGFAQLDVLAVRARYLESTTQAQLWRAPPVAAAFGIGVGVRVW